MRAYSFYCPAESPLHRANPMTKLAALLWFGTVSFVLPWPALWLASFLMLLSAFPLGVGRAVLRRYLVLSLPFLLAVFLFHGFVLDRPDFRPLFPILHYSPAGLEHAALIGGRISLMLSASLLFVATTHPATLLRSFDAAGWPPGLSFLLASPLLLIDQFAARARAIRDAQMTRGLNVDAGVPARLRAIRILIVPLVTLALADAQERAGVLTARGFRALPFRTVAEPPADSLFQRRLRIGLLVLAALQAGYGPWP
jgi:energy-coupling factor transport system permease protein